MSLRLIKYWCITLLILLIGISFTIDDQIKKLKAQLNDPDPLQQYQAALNLSMIYRDSLFDLSQEKFYIKEAIRLSRDNNFEKEQATAMLNYGTHFTNTTLYDSAQAVFQDLKLLNHVKADTLLSLQIDEYIANTYQQQNKLPEALMTYHELIINYEALGTFNGHYIACINRCNAAYIQILQKNFEKAVELLKPCSVIPTSTENEQDSIRDLSVNYNLFLARSFEELMQYDSASHYYTKTLETSQEIKYPYTEAYAYLGLGSYEAEANKDYNKAKNLLESALTIFRSIEYPEGIIPSLNRLSSSVYKLGYYRLADQYAEEAVDLAHEINNFEGLKDGYENLSEIAIELGQYKLAIDHYKKHVIYKDSILNLERDKAIQENNARFNKQLQDIEIANLAEKNKLESRKRFFQLISFIAGIVALIVLAYYLLTRQKLKQSNKAAQYEKQVSTALNKFVPRRFLKTLGREHILEVELGDQIEQEVTVVFTDIRSYTTLSESMTPNENFKFVKEYAEKMGPSIVNNHGFVNQYLGDGIMAIFQRCPEDALRACIQMQEAVREFNRDRVEHKELGPVRVGMGMHTGSLVMGIIGDEYRQDAALISDTVNTAARLESLTKEYGTGIILSGSTLDRIKDKSEFNIRHLGRSLVKGKTKEVVIYECIDGDSSELMSIKKSNMSAFADAVHLYDKGYYDQSRIAFKKLSLKYKDDMVITKFLERLKYKEENAKA